MRNMGYTLLRGCLEKCLKETTYDAPQGVIKPGRCSKSGCREEDENEAAPGRQTSAVFPGSCHYC